MTVSSALALCTIGKLQLHVEERKNKKLVSVFDDNHLIIAGFALNIISREDFLFISDYEKYMKIDSRKNDFKCEINCKINSRRVRLLSTKKDGTLVWQIKDGKNYIQKKHIEGDCIWNVYNQIFHISDPILITRINEYEIAWFFNGTLEYELRNLKNNTYNRKAVEIEDELSEADIIEYLNSTPLVIQNDEINFEYDRFLAADLGYFKVYEIALGDDDGNKIDLLFEFKTSHAIYRYSYLDLLLFVDEDYILYYNNLINLHNELNSSNSNQIQKKFFFAENIITVKDIYFLRNLNNFIEFVKDCSFEIINSRIRIGKKTIVKSNINPLVWYDPNHSVYTVLNTGGYKSGNCFSWFGHSVLTIEYLEDGVRRCKKIHMFKDIKDDYKLKIGVEDFKQSIKLKTRSWIKSITDAKKTIRDAEDFSQRLNNQLLKVCFNIFAKKKLIGVYNSKEDVISERKKQKENTLNLLTITKKRNKNIYKLYFNYFNCLYFVNFLLNRVGIELEGFGGVNTPKIITEINKEVNWIINYQNLKKILNIVKRIIDLKLSYNNNVLSMDQKTIILLEIEQEQKQLEKINKLIHL